MPLYIQSNTNNVNCGNFMLRIIYQDSDVNIMTT